METLSYLENKIIEVIAETHPFTLGTVEMIYRRCKSFDRTIEMLEYSFSNRISALCVLKKFGY